MKAKDLMALLQREPLGYRQKRRSGSHRILVADGRGQILFSAHDGVTVPPRIVRQFLVKQAGLTEEDALKLLRGGAK